MAIHFKPHALVRMQERGVTSLDIERVLVFPVGTVRVRFGRQAAFGNINGRQLLVVYDIRDHDVEVVTTFWINREGLKRYGFTRI